MVLARIPWYPPWCRRTCDDRVPARGRGVPPLRHSGSGIFLCYLGVAGIMIINIVVAGIMITNIVIGLSAKLAGAACEAAAPRLKPKA